jgi:hypothetical protein
LKPNSAVLIRVLGGRAAATVGCLALSVGLVTAAAATASYRGSDSASQQTRSADTGSETSTRRRQLSDSRQNPETRYDPASSLAKDRNSSSQSFRWSQGGSAVDNGLAALASLPDQGFATNERSVGEHTVPASPGQDDAPAATAPPQTEPPAPTAPPVPTAPPQTEPPAPTAPPVPTAPPQTEPPAPTAPPVPTAPPQTEPPAPTAPPQTDAPLGEPDQAHGNAGDAPGHQENPPGRRGAPPGHSDDTPGDSDGDDDD